MNISTSTYNELFYADPLLFLYYDLLKCMIFFSNWISNMLFTLVTVKPGMGVLFVPALHVWTIIPLKGYPPDTIRVEIIFYSIARLANDICSFS